MKTVARSEYIAANSFDAFPELGISTESLLAVGQVATYNALVGNARSSLLLPVAYELDSGHVDAGAFCCRHSWS